MARTSQAARSNHKRKENGNNPNNTPMGDLRYPQDQSKPSLKSKEHSKEEAPKRDAKEPPQPVAAKLDGAAEAPKKQQQQPKKKKKNAPDRQQPEWMFPPDESNPVLNPKHKTPEELLKDKEEWDAAIKFLKYRAHTAPVKTAPPKQLLTLVGAFLTAYGFNNTSRIYQLQCSSRKRLDGWDSVLDEKLPKEFPDLVKIYKDWFKTYEEKKKMDETSSSDSDDSVATKKRKIVSKDRKAREAAKAQVEQTSSSESSEEKPNGGSDDDSSSNSDSDSDVDMKGSTVPAKSAKKSKMAKKPDSSSSATSCSDSDADDENDTAGLGAPSRKPTVNGLINNLKRKKSSTSSSSLPPSTSEDAPAPKKAKKADRKAKATINDAQPAPKQVTPKVQATASSSSSSSSSDSSSSKSDPIASTPAAAGSNDTTTPLTESALPRDAASPSSSSSSSSDSSSDDDNNDFPVPKLNKKKSLLHTSKPSSDSSATFVPTPTIAAPANELPNSTDPSEKTKKTRRKRSASPSTAPVPNTSNSPPPSEPPSKRSSSFKTKTRNPTFTRVPPPTSDSPLTSNAYQPYDYAERAHQDLSVTKGKGFTKEKNKKKRGSYRGGAIDVGGGRGVKFED